MTPRWIFLRGLMRDARHWGGFPSAFADALGVEPPLLMDLPGNGLRHHEQSPASVPAMAEWLRAELRRQGHRPPWRVLAMSLGAMVTVAWADTSPQELDAAVLLNTSLKPFSPFHARLQPRAWPTALGLALGNPAPREVEAAILRLTSARRDHPPALLDDWTRWRQTHPVSRANALRQLAAAARYQAPRTTPAVPMLILNGAGDTLVSPRCSSTVARAWGVPLAVHRSAGHDLPLDDGAWVSAAVREWLRQKHEAPH